MMFLPKPSQAIAQGLSVEVTCTVASEEIVRLGWSAPYTLLLHATIVLRRKAERRACRQNVGPCDGHKPGERAACDPCRLDEAIFQAERLLYDQITAILMERVA